MRKHSYEEQKRSLALPLLKKLERAKLQDLQESINEQEYAYKLNPQMKTESLQGLQFYLIGTSEMLAICWKIIHQRLET